MPRLMELPAGEMKEVFCGNYTTFVITSGFNYFFFWVSFLKLYLPDGDLLSQGKSKDGRLGRAANEDMAKV